MPRLAEYRWLRELCAASCQLVDRDVRGGNVRVAEAEVDDVLPARDAARASARSISANAYGGSASTRRSWITRLTVARPLLPCRANRTTGSGGAHPRLLRRAGVAPQRVAAPPDRLDDGRAENVDRRARRIEPYRLCVPHRLAQA